MTTGTPISVEFTSAGVPRSLVCGELSILQYPGTELEAGPHQIWLRRRSADGVHAVTGLLGPSSRAVVAVSDGNVVARGRDEGLEWCLWWDQPADGMFGWNLRVTNTGSEPVEIDVVCTLDVALTPWNVLRRNELYVSQYLDLTPVEDGQGTILAVRQNLPGPTTPWLSLSCTTAVAGWCTDALQVAGDVPGTGLDLFQDLPSTRLQHEHTLAGLQSAAVSLGEEQVLDVGFRVLVLGDHPDATGPQDAELVRTRLANAEWSQEPPTIGVGTRTAPTQLSPVRWLHGEALNTAEFLSINGVEPQNIEEGPLGEPWAYRSGDAHVVAGTKEMAVLRPHGHILVASEGPGPGDSASAVTVWMNGTVASQLTRGHADAEPLLSVRRSYLGLLQGSGVRLFVDTGEGWALLGVPSAWATESRSASWWWKIEGKTVCVRTHIASDNLTIECVVDGDAMPLMLMAHTDGEFLQADTGAVERRTSDPGPSRLVQTSDDGRLKIIFPLTTDARADDLSLLRGVPHLSGVTAIESLAEFLPWLAQDAMIHYQVPRGLEQFTGGAWGTRDVCQGPIGLLVSIGRLDLVRAVLLVIFGAQQDDGDWPQWFEYLHSSRAPGHRESHGDVVYWPLLALGEYLDMTGDVGIVEEMVGWVGASTMLPPTPVLEHVLAAVAHVEGHRAHDPRLPAYGHGDWNDSLQPADPELARWMTSTWTAELEMKSLTTLARGLTQKHPGLAKKLQSMASATGDALREHLLIDGELAGYAIIRDSSIEPLVHPRDHRTGLAHGSLQIIHALADELLTLEEAEDHIRIIDEHLNSPTGILLFNTPVKYHGGEMHIFVRAEASAYWGREIGLMYTHAHLRWVEALLRLGYPERAWTMLQLVVPIGLGEAVAGANPLQSNCYYSSIDAKFPDRGDADARADRLLDATFGFEGGWRVYSSGPGIILRLVLEGFLGLRWSADGVVIDPVLPSSLDGLCAKVVLGGRIVCVNYSVGHNGHGVESVTINGRKPRTVPKPARYREGGVLVSHHDWKKLIDDGPITLTIDIS